MAAPICAPLKCSCPTPTLTRTLFSFQLPGDEPDGRRPQQHREIPEAVGRARAVLDLPAPARTQGNAAPWNTRSGAASPLNLEATRLFFFVFIMFKRSCEFSSELVPGFHGWD